MNENPDLLTIVVLSGLLGALCLYVVAWFSAWRRRLGSFFGFWIAGSLLVVGAGISPFLLGIRFASDELKLGSFEMVARLFLVITTMGAFVPLIVIAVAALLFGGFFFLISRIFI